MAAPLKDLPKISSALAAKANSKFWLNAWQDSMANVHAYTSCVRFADVQGNGDYHLLVATVNSELKIYRGVHLIGKHMLLGVPVSITALYIDDHSEKPTLSVAVASGPYVFIYRNLRPFFKFTIPVVELHKKESSIWANLKSAAVITDIKPAVVTEELTAVRETGAQLSSRSTRYLALDDEDERLAFIEQHRHEHLVQKTVITCMETLAKDSEEQYHISRLVIGTETKKVLIVNPLDCSILVNCHLKGTPVVLAPLGLMAVDYRVLVACREGKVFIIKNGEVSGKVIEIGAAPLGLVCVSAKEIYIGVSGNVIHSYNIKAKKNFSMHLDSTITNMELYGRHGHGRDRGVLVALKNGEIRLYKGRQIVSVIQTAISGRGGVDQIMGMRCGRYGREDMCLAVAHKSGAMSVRVRRRNRATSVTASGDGDAPAEQEVPLNLPKKTKLYVEQTQREREQATDMHRIFQRDLSKLRLASAQAYVKLITDGNGLMSHSRSASVRLTVQVQGLGPLFKMLLRVQNMGRRVLMDVPIAFGYEQDLYMMPVSSLHIPVLIPGALYQYEVVVHSVDAGGATGIIRVHICNRNSSTPLISAVVSMPLSEVFFDS